MGVLPLSLVQPMTAKYGHPVFATCPPSDKFHSDLLLQHNRQVVEPLGNICMIGTQSLLSDSDSSNVQRHRFVVLALQQNRYRANG